MSQILKLAQLDANGLENIDISSNEVAVGSITVGGASGTNLTKVGLDLIIADTHAPASDNQNIVAGNGLSGGGSGATVTITVLAADGSILSASGGISVVKDPAGAIQLGGSGLFVGTDNSTIEKNTNTLRVKDLGITTAKLADGSVTNIKVVAGIDALKIGAGTVDNTEFGYLDGVTSSLQTQLNNKQPTLIYVDASTYLASGLAANTPITLPGSASFTSATAADIGIIVNDQWKEITRDFITVGISPYTQIQFGYDLPNDSVLRVKQIK